jgi:hypothetical protein
MIGNWFNASCLRNNYKKVTLIKVKVLFKGKNPWISPGASLRGFVLPYPVSDKSNSNLKTSGAKIKYLLSVG